MSETIRLVQGDTRPYISLKLKDADGNPIDVSTATVVLKFRAAGGGSTLFAIPCLKPGGGADGSVVIAFQPGNLNVSEGRYEGEIEIQFSSTDIQTIYRLLKFSVRSQFA